MRDTQTKNNYSVLIGLAKDFFALFLLAAQNRRKEMDDAHKTIDDLIKTDLSKTNSQLAKAKLREIKPSNG